MIRNFYKTVAFLGASLLASCSVNSDQPFKLAQVSDMVRVFEDGYNLPSVHDTTTAFGIRGEVLSAQLVLFSADELENVSVEISDLVDADGEKQLPASIVEWNFVGSVPLTENTTNQPVAALSRPAPADYPEYLMEERSISIPKETYQSIWLTIKIPQTDCAGTYAGEVTVKSLQGEQSLPIRLEVFPLTLPEERHLKIVEWYSTEGFSRFHGIDEVYSDEWFGMLAIYADNMVAHRQNIFRVPMSSIVIRQSGNGSLDFDFTRFDQIAQVFWNTGKMDYIETGFLTKFGEGDWFSTEVLLKDIEVKDRETGELSNRPGKEIIPYLLPAFERHLREKGWLDKTLFHVKDEPSIHNAISWMEMSSYMHKYAPELRRMDAIETTFLLDEIEVAVPKLDALETWYETFKEWQQEGNELWFYTVGIYQGSYLPNKTIDMPLIDSRILHWLNYRYDAVGYLHWGWNQWDNDPYLAPGNHFGDAWHVYPVKDGVLNSVRWEQMRNGIQDYEIFRMLEDRVTGLKNSLGTEFSWIDPKQRSKEIAGWVVPSMLEHAEDPTVLYAAKKEVIGELMEFDASPGIYVQTDPMENATLPNHSSVAVYGWAEPGTKIVVNGVEVPVSDKGLFLAQFTLSPEIDKITVQAGNAKGTKEIIRGYKIVN